MSSCNQLPEVVDWRSLVVFAGHGLMIPDAAKEMGISKSLLNKYRSGEYANPRYVTARRMLQVLADRSPNRLYECTGMVKLPAMPDQVDWNGVYEVIKEVTKTSEISEALKHRYFMAAHGQRSGRSDTPCWTKSSVLLNDFSRRASPEQYRQVITFDIDERAAA